MRKSTRHLSFLKKLSRNPSHVGTASLPELTTIVNILYNIDRIPFSSSEKRAVIKHLDSIRRITKATRERKVREELKQHGGSLLPLVLPAAISFLAQLI